MKKLLRKIGIGIFLLIFLFNSSFNYALAGYWGENFIANTVQTMTEKAMRVFEESMVANLKKIAIRLVMDRVRALILGQTAGGNRFITDYEDYIYGNAERVAKGAVRDFFSSVNQSVSSSTREMYRDIEKTVTSEISPIFDNMKPMVDSYLPGGKDDMFNVSKGGGISTFYLFLTNDVDNIVGARLAVQSRINELKMRTQHKQELKALTSNGYQPIESENGLISLPGKIVADIQSFVETMELRSLVNSQKIAEVIGGTAAMMVTQTLQSGINKAMQPVDNQLKNINKSVKGGINKIQNDIYKGIEFDGK